MKRILITTLAAGALCATAVSGLAGVAGSAGAAPSPSTRAAAAQPVRPSAAQAASFRAQLRAGTLSQDAGVSEVCAANHLRCQAEIVTAGKSSDRPIGQSASTSAGPDAAKPPIGYGATELQKAYGLTGTDSRTGTIVVIGAGAYPTLESDLAVYRSTYHLPACTKASGCFKQINYKGGRPFKPTKNRYNRYGEEEIGVETALDVDMASAACPACKIISMQVPLRDGFYAPVKQTHEAILHFATGVQTAKRLGASAVSISYGYPTDKYTDKGVIPALMTQPGLPIVSSSGDYGFLERFGQWPQSLTTVTSAGGTSLYPTNNARGYTELAWNGAGSGCTTDLPPANGQPAAVSRYCGNHRTASDISAVADPYTGVAVYDSYAPGSHEPYGFIVVGGTSVASPLLAGMYARAPGNDTVLGPNTIYAAGAGTFHDVTIGTNAGLGYCHTVGIGTPVCDSGPGWDGPTGRGTPKGLAPFGG